MNIQETIKYIDKKLERLEQERSKDTGNFYDNGLQSEEVWYNDGRGAYDLGFELGDMRGAYDAYMTIKIALEKGDK